MSGAPVCPTRNVGESGAQPPPGAQPHTGYYSECSTMWWLMKALAERRFTGTLLAEDT